MSGSHSLQNTAHCEALKSRDGFYSISTWSNAAVFTHLANKSYCEVSFIDLFIRPANWNITVKKITHTRQRRSRGFVVNVKLISQHCFRVLCEPGVTLYMREICENKKRSAKTDSNCLTRCGWHYIENNCSVCVFWFLTNVRKCEQDPSSNSIFGLGSVSQLGVWLKGRFWYVCVGAPYPDWMEQKLKHRPSSASVQRQRGSSLRRRSDPKPYGTRWLEQRETKIKEQKSRIISEPCWDRRSRISRPFGGLRSFGWFREVR